MGLVSTFKPVKWTGRAHRLAMHARRLSDSIVLHHPEYVIMESPAYGALKFPHTTVQLGELRGVILATLWDVGISVFDVAPKAVKKFATGNGNAKKDDMIDSAVAMNIPVKNSDEADAWWLWVIGMSKWDDGVIGVQMTDERQAVLAAIDWTPA